jgi:hypothetical protein
MNQDEELPTSPYLLHCHKCQKRLILQDNFMGIRKYECPENHIEVQWHNNEIVGYTIFWDADSIGEERYKLIGDFQKTNLYKKTKVRVNTHNKHWDSPRDEIFWKSILSMDHLLPLEIKNNIVVANNIIPRLKLLKAFT